LPQPNQKPENNDLWWVGIIIGLHLKQLKATKEAYFLCATLINPTRRNIEDSLNIFEDGKQPIFCSDERKPIFSPFEIQPQYHSNRR
jgi:hypothetical protein